MRALAALLAQSLLYPDRQNTGARTAFWVLKSLVALAVILYVGDRISDQPASVWTAARLGVWTRPGWIAAAALLLLPNLGLEALKWQTLMRRYYPDIRLGEAIQAVLAGMATGIFTPNRVGEYVGRMLYLHPGNRTEAGVYTFINRYAQLMPTLTGGAIALVWLIQTYGVFPGVSAGRLQGLAILTIVLSGVAGLTSLLVGYWFRHNQETDSRWHRIFTALGHLDVSLSLVALALSTLRYGVFSAQYVLLLYAFGYGGPLPLALACVGLVFLIKTGIPSISLAELGIRESVALAVMVPLGLSVPVVLGATFVLYLLNLALPALIGVGFVYRIRAEWPRSL
ncbi:MAG: lysylphosphatidylglycerol synthase transmembrane domain-containing protein [Bacteroidia bacterium]|nr:lysylphosphatidylglycerol synthase transmembrane domain-containing protein [Bacteroidia bacterium]